jgi:hypothetical protein
MERFDIRKLKYLIGAIQSKMSDEEIKKWMDKNNYTRDDLFEMIKILLNTKNKKD